MLIPSLSPSLSSLLLLPSSVRGSFDGKRVTAFGIGSFGPIDLNKESKTSARQ